MKLHIKEIIDGIFAKQNKIYQVNFEDQADTELNSRDLTKIIKQETQLLDVTTQARIEEELIGFGPLAPLILDEEINEILVNRYDQIFFEKKAQLFNSQDHFYSENSYNACIDRISQKAHTYMNREKPFIEVQIDKLRISIVFSELSRGSHILSIRKQPSSSWTLEKFKTSNWCTEEQFQIIKNILQNKKNFIVVGGTGSGKTSFLQALLNDLSELERAVIIEDTQELQLPNNTSVSLLTRQDPSQSVSDVTMDDLLKRALRLRPDRLVVGEIRGAEAKSLLMTMATGHDGSFGSMHARTASEAVMRLEMLIQMGAPQWSIYSIRKLLAMTIDYIFVLEKKDGARRLNGIFQTASVEENGLTLQPAEDYL